MLVIQVQPNPVLGVYGVIRVNDGALGKTVCRVPEGHYDLVIVAGGR